MKRKEALLKKRKKENKKKLSDMICDILIEEIVSLKLKPDTPLNMSQLAEEMGVSITPVREAVTKLQGLGLVNKGYYKQPTVGIGGYNDYMKLHEFRTILETEAAKQAAVLMTESDHIQLHRLAEKLEDAYRLNMHKPKSDKVVVTKEDIDFHTFAIACSQNPYIMQQYTKIKPKLLFFRQFVVVENEEAISVPQEHYMLCYALKTKDAAFAAEAFLHHGQAATFGKNDQDEAEKRQSKGC